MSLCVGLLRSVRCCLYGSLKKYTRLLTSGKYCEPIFSFIRTRRLLPSSGKCCETVFSVMDDSLLWIYFPPLNGLSEQSGVEYTCFIGISYYVLFGQVSQ